MIAVRWTPVPPPVGQAPAESTRTGLHGDAGSVNAARLKLAGVLASDVLKTADARKAIADRAHWHAGERRWVREGKLPRCGWMGEDVPESPRWRELAPQREAERRKLEQKRKAAPERLL